MDDALPLFAAEDRFAPSEDICSSRHGGNEQSEAAHADAKPGKKIQHARILAFVVETGPATGWEISVATGIPYTTTSARCSELRKSGAIYPTGRKRPTPTGCAAAVLAVSR